MKNIEIKIFKETRMVELNKFIIGNDGENLQGNLVFTFDEFVDGQARLEYVIDGNKNYIVLEKVGETYQVPILSVITKKGQIDMQVVITQGTEDVAIFKSNLFYLTCNASINAEIEQPEEYMQWIEVANAKLNEIDNLDIDAVKENGVATITITKKDGTQESFNLYDGEGAITDYKSLENKPSIGGVELVGDKTLEELNIQEKGNYLTSENDPLFKQSASYGITNQDIKNWNNKSEFSGNYDDLNGKPKIPTKTSELTNDSGYIKEIPSEYVTETELNNKGYLTEHQSLDHLQDKLISGSNIKTINGKSILGDGNIVVEGGGDYTLPVASKDTLGGIKVGANLTIEEDGTLNATASGGSGNGADDVPMNTIVEYDGEEVPDGWEEVGDINGVIVETGQNENGEWIKWSNGTMICNMRILVPEVNIDSAWGSGLFYKYILDDEDTYFPQPFIQKPTVNATIDLNSKTVFAIIGGVFKITETYFRAIPLIRGTVAKISPIVNITAVGQWK